MKREMPACAFLGLIALVTSLMALCRLAAMLGVGFDAIYSIMTMTSMLVKNLIGANWRKLLITKFVLPAQSSLQILNKIL